MRFTRQRQDEDGDGYAADEGDCDDYDASIHPNAFIPNCAEPEQMSGLQDYNCNGVWDVFDCVYTPVIIDIVGDGFRLTSAEQGASFDINGDGIRERVAWTSRAGDDAWLVLDRNHNGIIDSGQELFGNFTLQPRSAAPNGFLALAVFDTPAAGGTGDGWIDSADRIYSELRLWRDTNHDGSSQGNELLSLPAVGLSRLSLDYRGSRREDRWGNVFLYRSRIEGLRSNWMFDVFLTADYGGGVSGGQAVSRR